MSFKCQGQTAEQTVEPCTLSLLEEASPIKYLTFDECRNARRKGEVVAGERGSATPIFDHTGEAVRYPESLALNNLVYFLAAPTLVYQVAYPRSTRFRIRWLLK